METSLQQQNLHSQDYMNEQRNFWWNVDFLELMAKRWQFSKVRSVLDVGCGLGHWGQLLANVLPSDCQFTGVDRDVEWTVRAKERVRQKGLGDRFSYHPGHAEALPFPDETFDLVTCQTVLMHLKDPRRAISEFKRVLKPGGLIVVAEPNNRTSQLILDIISVEYSIENVLQALRFYLTCELGKNALGEGLNSIGCLVPGMFAESGLSGIEVYQSDKASALIPPYETTEQKVNAAQMMDYLDKGILTWDAEETRRYFLAGGGEAETFERIWEQQLSAGAEVLESIRQRRYHTAGGRVFYLVCGRKVC